MLKKLSVCLSLCGVLVLAACAAPRPVVTPTPPATANMTSSVTASATLMAISTPLPSVTPTPDPVRLACIEIQPALSEGHIYEGNLVLINANYSSEDWISLYNLQSGEDTILPQKYSSDPVVSPSRIQFAIQNYEENSIDVFSTRGEIIKSIPMQENWGWLADWVNNQQIAIVMAEPSDNPRFDKLPASVLILNPFTEQTQVLLPNYPYIDIVNPMIQFGGRWGSTIYDPSLSRVVYAGAEKFQGYLLYSLTEGKILAKIPNPNRRALPIWFSNGTQFIVLGGDDFYKVSASGEIKKITWFNPNYIINENAGLDYFIRDYYSLSPNENLLAFWLARHDENISWNQTTFTLAILNLETGEIIDTCIISSDYTYEHLPPLAYPIWSPDSKNLLVSPKYSQGSEGNLVLFDQEKQAAYKLPSDWVPTGWLLPEE